MSKTRTDVVSYFRTLRTNGPATSTGTSGSRKGSLDAGYVDDSQHGTPASTPKTPDFVTQAKKNQDLKAAASSVSNPGTSYVRGQRSMIANALPNHVNKNLLVLDIDETLVHSSFRPVPCDLTIPVVVEGQTYQVYIKFRPFLMKFMQEVSQLFECCVFTASLSAYANGLMDHLDPGRKMCPHRLFREHCSHVNGAYIKDMSLLGRDLHRIMIADNSPVAYLFQPRNAIPIVSWFDDANDTELLDLLPWLRRAAVMGDVYPILDEYRNTKKK